MRYNNSSGQYRFRYFSSSTYSGQQAIALYKERVGDTPTPGTGNVVRMPNLRIVDQFAEKIPATNDHPNRYTYYLKLDGGDKESSMVPVPVQHTGAVLQGYYTLNEMLNDTDPDNFLPENMLSAEVDMNLSPTSAPYFYTINSVKNDVPASASDYDTYISVLQRRSAGDYQEMYKPDAASGFTGYTGQIHPSGEYDFFDFRAIQAEAMDDSLSYVPILWTNGIDRHWFVEDSLNNSYGAPLWINRIGNVNIVSSQIERQATVKQNGDIVWNPSVNWYDADSTQAYSLYLISDLQAEGILPNCNVEYEPYMFRLWLVDSTYSLRGYKWENLGQAGQHIVDDPESTPDGAWLLLDTKMCNNYQTVNGVSTYVPDLTYTISKVDGNQQGNSWADNIMFGAKISSTFKPRLVVRFYYKEKVKQQLTPVEPSELRGNRDGENDDHVGYVVLRGTNPNDPSTAVFEIVATGEVVSRTYYNTMGVMSEKPFEGVNIVVTRYSDGTTSTSKVLY